MFRLISAFVLILSVAVSAAAQSTAINGTIEGTVMDEQGAVLPGVTVTVTNLDTGDTPRRRHQRERALPRAAAAARHLPRRRRAAGLQEVRADRHHAARRADGGDQHQAGRSARCRRPSPSPPIRRWSTSARSSGGRTLTEAEIKTLPLTSRNPYNFALLQPGVVGFENQEFGVPRITANGALLRLNYQIDGSNNTQKDRAGLRQMPMSEVMIREVKVVTTGYAPEFGQTMGLIYNAITPSGTNTVKGQASYRMQRKPFAAFPFFTQGPHDPDRKPPTDVNIITVDTRRADRARPHALLRRLRAHRARSVGRARDHDHAGQPGGARPERAAVHADRAQHRVRHRQGRSPDQRHQPPVVPLSSSSTTSSSTTSAAG